MAFKHGSDIGQNISRTFSLMPTIIQDSKKRCEKKPKCRCAALHNKRLWCSTWILIPPVDLSVAKSLFHSSLLHDEHA